MYFGVLAVEQVYAEWTTKGLGIDGSYRLFKEITNVYEFLREVEKGCKWREIIDAILTKTIDGQFALTVDMLGDIILNLFTFWYGVAWNNPEDSGVGVGVWIKLIYKIKMEDFLESDDDWECPTEDEIERITYNDWVIGY